LRLAVVGGGVAGCSVAYFAARAGADVVLVDAGVGRASDVPAALVNPVRGQNGRVPPRALEGMRVTWALVNELEAAGYVIPHDRSGVFRPVPDARTQQKWAQELPSDLRFEWRAPTDVTGLTVEWHSVLHVLDGGWLDGAQFVRALREASGATVIASWAREVTPGRVTLETGVDVRADAVIWCGGSIGASRGGFGGLHRRGTLLLLDAALTEQPVSYGVYAAPSRGGGVLGATFETPDSMYREAPVPLASLAWLTASSARLFGSARVGVTGQWSGSRYASNSATFASTPSVTGLGSKGFLLGPLLAREAASRLGLPTTAPSNDSRAP